MGLHCAVSIGKPLPGRRRCKNQKGSISASGNTAHHKLKSKLGRWSHRRCAAASDSIPSRQSSAICRASASVRGAASPKIGIGAWAANLKSKRSRYSTRSRWPIHKPRSNERSNAITHAAATMKLSATATDATSPTRAQGTRQGDIADQHFTAGTAPTDFDFTRTREVQPVHCIGSL